MTGPEILMLVAVILCGLAALWNVTAGALVASYVIARGTYWFTGEPLGTVACIYVDLAVISIIYMKPPAHDCLPYRSRWHQLACFWLEKSLWDRVVILCFPLMWAAYALISGGSWLQWWVMYWAAMAQFVAAFIEAAENFRSRRAANAEDAGPLDAPSSSSEFAWAWGVRGSG